LKNGKSLLKARLDRCPDEIATHRFLMELSSEEEKKQMVDRYAKKFQNTQNPDYLYLSIRTMEDNEWQDEQFVKAFAEYDDNAWLAYASGLVYGNRGEWRQSLNAYESIESDHPVYQYSCELNTRVRRLYNSRFEKSEWASILSCDDTQYLTDLELGKTNDAYDLLNKDLMEGYILGAKHRLNNFTKDEIGTLLPIIAASSGDNEALVDQVLSDGLNYAVSQNLPSIIGLWIREGRNTEPAVEQYVQQGQLDEDLARIFRTSVKSIEDSDLDAAKKSINESDSFVFRALMKSIACIAMEDEVPEAWFEEVNCLLFFYERPYFER
ncbi:hypothetical protein N9Y60_05670, partial [Crocinitomicaceae bacterium]|nr:hypothetical protein [Crocinitomicaceae bacterium]